MHSHPLNDAQLRFQRFRWIAALWKVAALAVAIALIFSLAGRSL